MATIRDVARRAQVSVSTVSYALTGERPISDETRRRIQDAIDVLGYRANGVAQSLKTGRTRTLGLIIPDILNSFFTVVARAAEDAAMALGYNLILCNSCNDAAREAAYLNLLRSRRIDGLIYMAGSGEAHSSLRTLAEEGFPLVIVDEDLPGIEATSIFVENVAGAILVGEHLALLGHRRVGLIGGPPALRTAQERIAGVREGLARYGVEVPPEACVAGDYQLESGRAAASALLDAWPRPTAIFAANDMMAIGAIQEAQRRGLSVPSDLSIAGFDDIPLARMLAPALTTVAQPAESMGRHAVSLLLSIVEERSTPGEHVTLGTELRVRASTMAAPPVVDER